MSIISNFSPACRELIQIICEQLAPVQPYCAVAALGIAAIAGGTESLFHSNNMDATIQRCLPGANTNHL
jgi:hypothetical protein